MCPPIKTPLMLALLALLSLPSYAQSFYFNDMRLKSDLDWLNAQGVIQVSTSTWPLSANELQRVLAQAKVSTPEQQQLLSSLQRRLVQQGDAPFSAQASLYLQSERQALPQRFADDRLAQRQANVAFSVSQPHWQAQLQANLKQDDLIEPDNKHSVSFEGSYVAATWANQWLLAGQVPAWWGPGNEGSLIRGDASQPVVGMTLQRDRQTAPESRYLSWIGPWQYQLFAGQLADYQAVPDTKLMAMRMTVNPKQWLEVGASRAIMWGGEGRPESLSSLFDALTGLRDNGDTGKQDPANQLAGFDARVKLDPLVKVPASLYAQYVGEDEAGGLPSKKMYLLGADYAASVIGQPYQLYMEYADTGSGGEVQGISYNHSTYRDGYYQQGYPLGHALGGDAESVTLGGKLWWHDHSFIHAKLQSAKVNQSGRSTNQAFPKADTLKVVDVSLEHQFTPQLKGSVRAWAVDSDIHSTEVGGGIGVEFAKF